MLGHGLRISLLIGLPVLGGCERIRLGAEIYLPAPPPLVSAEELNARVDGWFRASYGEGVEIRLDVGDAGTYYRPIDPEEVAVLLARDGAVDRRLYRRGHFDCEDFAIASRAVVVHASLARSGASLEPPPAFGILFTRTHATNIGLDADLQPYLFDWYYDVIWEGPTLEGALFDELGAGWSAPGSVRYVLI